jgi:hypothetical protein
VNSVARSPSKSDCRSSDGARGQGYPVVSPSRQDTSKGKGHALGELVVIAITSLSATVLAKASQQQFFRRAQGHAEPVGLEKRSNRRVV